MNLEPARKLSGGLGAARGLLAFMRAVDRTTRRTRCERSRWNRLEGGGGASRSGADETVEMPSIFAVSRQIMIEIDLGLTRYYRAATTRIADLTTAHHNFII